MPGFTGYAGLNEIGKPKKGETVVVAAATGPVGSLVGQLAKIAGARAVGIAGGPEKCAYLANELGFDAAVDHKSAHFLEELKAACPEGVDVYYENVGGAVWQAVLPLLNRFARVPVSGLIAHYDSSPDTSGPNLLPATMRLVISQRLLIQGFLNFDYIDKLFAEFQHVVGNNILGALSNTVRTLCKALRMLPRHSWACSRARTSASYWSALRNQTPRTRRGFMKNAERPAQEFNDFSNCDPDRSPIDQVLLRTGDRL